MLATMKMAIAKRLPKTMAESARWVLAWASASLFELAVYVIFHFRDDLADVPHEPQPPPALDQLHCGQTTFVMPHLDDPL